MAKYIDEEGRTYELDLEKLRHEARLQEIEAKKKADLEIEEAKRQTALMVEDRRAEASLRTENRKGLWALGAGLAGLAAGVLITVVANRRDISQREISSTVNNRKLLR